MLDMEWLLKVVDDTLEEPIDNIRRMENMQG